MHCASRGVVLLLFPTALPILAQQSAPLPPVDPAGIRGSLMIVGGGSIPDAVRLRFLELAGGDQGHVVVVPTASASADKETAEKDYLDPWRKLTKAELSLLHTRVRAEADSETFTAKLRAATGVWFGGGDQSRLAEVYVGTRFEKELQALLLRGGVIGGSSAGAAIQCHTMIASGNPVPQMGTGLDLLPRAILDQHFIVRKREPRLLAALAANPGHFGIGIDESTAVEVHGRSLQVLGKSEVLLALPAGAGREVLKETLKAGESADLVTWQRRAQGRASAPFPPPQAVPPVVPAGTLILAGGGALPTALVDRFIQAAGGPEAPIVVVPTADGREGETSPPGFERTLAAAGATNVRTFHAASPSEVAKAKNLDFLKTARGLWFGGGRQWRLVDAYAGTEAEAAFHAVLARGGVIAGSSAGCSIQAQFMVRGNPLGNREIAFEGYEQGFGFLPGCGVDQHFFKRGREADLETLVRLHPQVLGIGVDESAWIVVKGSTMEVLGGRVAVYDRRGLAPEAATVKAAHDPGARVELRMRER
jgi:cyanophycinase